MIFNACTFLQLVHQKVSPIIMIIIYSFMKHISGLAEDENTTHVVKTMQGHCRAINRIRNTEVEVDQIL